MLDLLCVSTACEVHTILTPLLNLLQIRLVVKKCLALLASSCIEKMEIKCRDFKVVGNQKEMTYNKNYPKAIIISVLSKNNSGTFQKYFARKLWPSILFLYIKTCLSVIMLSWISSSKGHRSFHSSTVHIQTC